LLRKVGVYANAIEAMDAYRVATRSHFSSIVFDLLL
jgi:hypothetical protein